jgi:hypothetical protein
MIGRRVAEGAKTNGTITKKKVALLQGIQRRFTTNISK